MGLSLDKGQAITLKKDNGSVLTSVTVGLGWDPVAVVETGKPKFSLFGKKSAPAAKDIDLDASIIAFDVNRNTQDIVYYGKKKSTDGSIKHHGDNLTGNGDGDDEQIDVNLSAVAPHIHHLAVVITSFSGQTFDEVENVFCRLVDNTTGKEEVRYDLKESGPNGGQVMVILSRAADGWSMKAVGTPVEKGRTPDLLVATAKQLI